MTDTPRTDQCPTCGYPHHDMTLTRELAAAQERIAELEKELEELVSDVREWMCEKCRTVFPGPPQPGTRCVVCPKCGGNTMPKATLLIKNQFRLQKPERELAAAKERINVQADNLVAALETIQLLRDLCAATYQLAGVIGAPTRFLDALADSAAGASTLRQPVEALLPVRASECDVVAELERERDEALQLAGGPATLREVANECVRARMREGQLEKERDWLLTALMGIARGKMPQDRGRYDLCAARLSGLARDAINAAREER